MSARALMVLGTGSHVGKSVVAAALGRIFADKGYRVAPFKAQNMSLNSAATPDGREIGRAQAMQAEACRAVPTADMNPILIKPSSEIGAQIVVLGRVWGQVTAADYHTRRVEELFGTVLDSYQRLAAYHDIIVIEGAGSPAEINLRAHDIVNMRMAKAAGASCLLLGDIDRGGVFAAILGTFELLEPDERTLVRGFAINKFRGDIGLLRPGIQMMEQRIDWPCTGVIPYLADIGIEEEDGVAIEDRRTTTRIWGRSPREKNTQDRPLRIGVVALPHLANFTDYDPLAKEPSVALVYLERAEETGDADLLILPGSKQTLDDLEWLHRTGFTRAILEHHRRGGAVLGICGGMQILGRRVEDPTGIESDGVRRASEGLGLLPIVTVLNREKVTRRVTGRLLSCQLFGQKITRSPLEGYEIHVGETIYDEHARPFADICRAGEGTTLCDGVVSMNGLVVGTYVHGLLDEDHFRHAFVRAARAACGLAPPRGLAPFSVERDRRFDRLAKHVRNSLDMDRIESWLDKSSPGTLEC